MLPKKKKQGKGLFDHLQKEKKGLFLHLKKESKDEEWFRIKQEIRPFFVKHGLINICELKLPMCIGNVLPLHFAHSKKREDIAKEEPERTRELKEVVRACPKCHDYIEHLPEKDGVSGRQRMYNIVIACIEIRNRRLARWKKISA